MERASQWIGNQQAMSSAPPLAAEAVSAILNRCQTPVTPDEAVRLAGFLALLLRWNDRVNLTSLRNAEEMVQRHIADSVFCARDLPQGLKTLLDFGSGGGFPGIPIALLRTELSVTLAESQSRKSAFLREAVRSL